ncbi:hypothetical protein NDU88_004285 [Pleurodeles waltl]|uniref:Uncharacterized protein n=1 Tax=Pleurodeles waltl TaxID=8319 RepID=A0AAV7W7U1_PLEWA|nr:hypothetical protein NDU88_004285 [Pleurodeles waltl]
MCRAPALGMPDYEKPFLLFCHERDACSLSVLTQVHGDANRPVAYFSATLDPVAAAFPGCLRAVAAVGQSLSQCEGIVMGYRLTVMVPHSVEILLTRTKTQHMTNARLTRYETIILGSPNVTLKRCTVLNPATLLPNENTEIKDGEEFEHDCLEVTELCTKPRPDIQDTQLKENDCIMFVDGSCLRDSAGTLKASYAVCTITGIVEASWLEKVFSAQVAELIALTKACHAAVNLKVTIYTDSRYGFGIVHDFGQLWSQRGFMTSSGSPVKNGKQIRDLLHAIQLPLEIAVEQWELLPQPENDTSLSLALRVVDTLDELKTLQSRASKEEKHSWQRMQCVQRADDLWVSEEGKLVLPNSLLSQFARLYHGQAHLGRDAMIRSFKIDWFNPKFRHAAEITCHRCVICRQMNAGKGTVVTLSHIGRAGGSFNKLQMDFIEMPVCGGLKYVLVIVCVFSHWIEAYPTRRNDSLTVAKLLLRELIPRFGFPVSIESDRGRHFDNEVIKLLCAALNIEQKVHCSYRPEASGLVEQMNGTLKSRIAKMCAATNMKWPDALPLVLMSMRNTPDKKTRLSPHEILMGRAMRLPAVPANELVNITDNMVLDYCRGLADVIRSFSHQVEANTLPPIGEPGHSLQAGDWVVVKKHVRKSCLEPRWKGPYQVILTTTTAVKCAGVPNWIHASHPKRVTCPVEEELEVSGTATSGREISESEISQEGTETTGEPTENSLVPQTVNEFERGDRVPISVEAAGELSQGEVLPEVNEYGLEPELSIEPEDEREGEIVDTNQNESEPPEPVAGPPRGNTISQEEGAFQRSEGKHRTKTHRGDNWPDKSHPKIREVSNETIIEESDTSQTDDLSEGEQQEKSFLDHTDDRRKALKERLEKGLEKRTYANDYAYTAIKTQGKLPIDALHSKWTFMLNGQDPAIPRIYYICGLNAYYRLPKGWYGTCYLGIAFPKIYQIDDLKQIPKTSESQHPRQKRESVAAVIGDIFGAIIPSVGVILNSMKIQKLSTIVDNMLTNFTGAILLMDTELAAERAMTLQNRLALDILLAKSGGVCKMLNERHCCSFIPDNSKKIRNMLTNLTRDSTDLKDLKELGVWEKFGKGIARVGSWFTNIWNGVLAKIMMV